GVTVRFTMVEGPRAVRGFFTGNAPYGNATFCIATILRRVVNFRPGPSQRNFVARHPPFAERILWNMSRSRHPSGFAPENLTTLAHCSVSSAMSLLKSEVEPANTVPPRSAIRALIRGSVRATLISLLSLSMILVGVFLGAATPNQPLDS